MLWSRTIEYAMITISRICGASFWLTMSWVVERKNDLAAGSAPSMSFGIHISGVFKDFSKEHKFPQRYSWSLKVYPHHLKPRAWLRTSYTKAYVELRVMEELSLLKLFVLQSQRLDQRNVLHHLALFIVGALFGGWMDESPCFLSFSFLIDRYEYGAFLYFSLFLPCLTSMLFFLSYFAMLD